MKLKKLPDDLTVCKLAPAAQISLDAGFFFLARTDEELSLVGILSKISAVLADNGIGIFAVSTYNTDYILVKKEDLGRALAALAAAGYEVAE